MTSAWSLVPSWIDLTGTFFARAALSIEAMSVSVVWP